MSVGGNAIFNSAIFAGPARFSGSIFMRGFDLNGVDFKSDTSPPRFDDVKTGSALFSLSSFNRSRPSQDTGAKFGGMSFENIEVRADKTQNRNIFESYRNLISLADQSAYNTDVYATFERFLQKSGAQDQADEVFIHQKRRERRELLSGLSWLRSLLLDWLVVYGRKPWWAFIYSVIIVLVGFVIFRKREGMIPLKTEDGSRRYSAFWYSLDLFAPIIDLDNAKIWGPEKSRWFARNYAPVHRILGWILIPLGLAALTGIVK
jgi:hypothetical protein